MNLHSSEQINLSSMSEYLVNQVENNQLLIQDTLDKNHQSLMGQFFTPSNIAKMMAEMFFPFSESVNLLDPGAGIGILSAAFVSTAIASSNRPKKINITAFEVDSNLILELNRTLENCRDFCRTENVDFQFEIRQEDFILSSSQSISGKNSFFPIEESNYNYAILNPPYRKINAGSKTYRVLKNIGIETTNLYTAFISLVMRLVVPGSEMVAIIPRSFCNGTYFKSFRKELLHTMKINRIHVFGSRDRVFKEGNVLQENIIIHAQKGMNQTNEVIISSNDNPEDVDLITQEIEYDQLVHPDDTESFIHIVSDGLGNKISYQMNQLITNLEDLGITVSTGRVVDFRSKHLLRDKPDIECIPLIYPINFRNGFIEWPLEKSKKPSFLASKEESSNLLVPSQNYVFVKRFSAKEEKKRIYAAVYDPSRIQAKRVGIENHLNYFHRHYGGLSLVIAKGLALFLNSSLVDQYFRQFSGHTQVNATDLRNLKYPTEEQLIFLGTKVSDQFPSQDLLDKLISECLFNQSEDGDTNMEDPIRTKKKIREALNILKLLNVPKAQQNDRSALTLLALVNMNIDNDWPSISENLIGITEMMDFFRINYGINYAPNTRETVRRQTIHQFLQIGLVKANPDDPNRPINSPKTRYLIEPGPLNLLRSYNSKDWNNNLAIFLKNTPTLSNLQVKERNIPLIPVTLPDGEEILISSGGQNELIKHIVEEFCPRFTPGGKLIYIGDAIGKLNEKEITYFEQIGIKIDKHGKMPDVIVELPEKKWLVLIEAVTSHGPVDLKRKNELESLFGKAKYDLVFVTSFESRRTMHKFLNVIAWETEVWVSEAPSHLIHFNGEKFLGPY